MTGDDDGLARFLERPHLLDKLIHECSIQRGGGLIGDDPGGIVDQGAGDGHALGLAAGEQLAFLMHARLQAKTLKQRRGPCL